MFASAAIATVVLAGSLAMPHTTIGSNNPWSENDWAPLKVQYQVCAETSHSVFFAYVCMTKAYTVATTNLKKA